MYELLFWYRDSLPSTLMSLLLSMALWVIARRWFLRNRIWGNARAAKIILVFGSMSLAMPFVNAIGGGVAGLSMWVSIIIGAGWLIVFYMAVSRQKPRE